jgi:hypothetical protein
MAKRPPKGSWFNIVGLDVRGELIRKRFPWIEARLEKFRDEIATPEERPEGWICSPAGVYVYDDGRVLADILPLVIQRLVNPRGEDCGNKILQVFPVRTVRFKLNLKDFIEFKEEFRRFQADRKEEGRRLRLIFGCLLG